MTWLDQTHVGDVRELVPRMAADGVRAQCVVTSPPYWALRDYGVDGQLGLEPTIEAYIADGWYLRSDVVWSKPNPMPESAADRPTKSHEYVFLLSKRERYFSNFAAIEEPVTGGAHRRHGQPNPPTGGWADGPVSHSPIEHRKRIKQPDGWDTENGAHGNIHRKGRAKGKTVDRTVDETVSARMGRGAGWRVRNNESLSESIGDLVETRNSRSVWSIPTEAFKGAHFATFPRALVRRCVLSGSKPGDVVFDPFMGSGTVGEVALALGRRYVGTELNPEYVATGREHRPQALGLPL